MAKQDSLDPQTRDLVRFAAAIAQGYEPELRERVGPLRVVAGAGGLGRGAAAAVGAHGRVSARARRLHASGASSAASPAPGCRRRAGLRARSSEWTRRGEEVCATVYGENYRKLRDSVRALHPAIDSWMITEGYGRTLGRPGLDLMRRELCTVAQTAVLETPRAAPFAPARRAQRGRLVRPDRRRALDRQSAALLRPVEKGQGAVAHGARRVVAGELMFIDHAVVRVTAGTGGSGACSFARFKYMPKGGPDGGDGGRGGSVYVRGDANLATLLDYRYRTIWKAERGEHGKGKTKTGASADGHLPAGPARHRHSRRRHRRAARRGAPRRRHAAGGARRAGRAGQRPLRHLDASGAARMGAGRGRRGARTSSWCSSSSPTSAWWASPTPARARCSPSSRPRVPRSPTIRSPRSSPTSASSGSPGTARFVVADIPGIIEGAHQGKGLGLQFLQHVERTRVLAFLIPLDAPDPQRVYDRLRHEVAPVQRGARGQAARRGAHQARPARRRQTRCRRSTRPRPRSARHLERRGHRARGAEGVPLEIRRGRQGRGGAGARRGTRRTPSSGPSERAAYVALALTPRHRPRPTAQPHPEPVTPPTRRPRGAVRIFARHARR